MKYEIIIFDADETIFDFKKSEREALKNVAYSDKNKAKKINSKLIFLAFIYIRIIVNI